MYSVKEIFLTLQGEGSAAGRPAVFLRFAGCNLWSGREADRVHSVCRFCDTDFVGTDGQNGGKFLDAQSLATRINQIWGSGEPRYKYVVCTGGEPLLQLDTVLIAELKANGFIIAVETNGTIQAPEGVDHICVSPKSTAELKQISGTELKLVYPQEDAPPEKFTRLSFDYFYLQPKDGAEREKNTRLAVEYCLKNPQWRLSAQTHKYIGID